MDAQLVWKTLKNFNLTTTNAILMKHTTIMYLHESVNWKPLRARNSAGFFFFFFHALPCIASPVKFLYKFHEKPLKINPKRLLR